MLGIFFKSPVDQLDYDIDFSRWLADGDMIASASAVVRPADSMVSAAQVIAQPEIVKVWLVDGVSGKTASIIVTATTAQCRVKQVEFQLRVRD
ncbi:hypothetical protein [Burkholderia mayonis]|uniref:Uncharacterized protein n=1 Tax=Burkholderia mayonis TaxID=1385591 RepID=A0A1B4G164_9BURK|nr:hypothetical protein [Burkholderia mayonis]AOJ09661.1 hypothetical protein WS71_20340 [Burkholderia mayonis]KVE52282.1 hypothetical protein WS71_10165 [Burkholderia mayonis]